MRRWRVAVFLTLALLLAAAPVLAGSVWSYRFSGTGGSAYWDTWDSATGTGRFAYLAAWSGSFVAAREGPAQRGTFVSYYVVDYRWDPDTGEWELLGEWWDYGEVPGTDLRVGGGLGSLEVHTVLNGRRIDAHLTATGPRYTGQGTWGFHGPGGNYRETWVGQSREAAGTATLGDLDLGPAIGAGLWRNNAGTVAVER